MSSKRRAFTSCYWIVLLTLLVGVLIVMFQWRNAEMIRFANGHYATPLDGRWQGYTPTEAADLFNRLGADGRKFYAISEVSLDLVFPFAYGALLIMLVRRLWQPSWRSIFVVICILTAGTDLIENGIIAYLAFTYRDSVQPLAYMANLVTLTKWGLLCIALLSIFIGALLWLLKARRV